MTRFEPGSFAVESDHSANCTAITAKEKRLKLFGFIVVVVRQVLVVKVENVGFVHSWPSLHHDLAKTSLPQSGDAPISSLSLSLSLTHTLLHTHWSNSFSQAIGNTPLSLSLSASFLLPNSHSKILTTTSSLSLFKLHSITCTYIRC